MTGRPFAVGLLATLSALVVTPVAANAHEGRRPSVVSVVCDHTFHIVPSPIFTGHDDLFRGVAAISSTDAWAVGFDNYTDATGSYVEGPLAEHWDGTAWTKTTVPVPSDSYGVDIDLFAVAAGSSSDVWAVGQYDSSVTGWKEPLIEHWDGAAWTLFPRPRSKDLGAVARSVAVISAQDAWLVGVKNPGNGERTYTAHWDGTKWSKVKSPNKLAPGGAGDELQGVSASSSTDVWAVGQAVASGAKPLVEHWDGVAWSVVKSARVSFGAMSGVAAISPNDVLTIGSDADLPNGAMSEHWNGTNWKLLAVPPPYPDEVNLTPQESGISAASSTDAWLVGNDTYGLIADHWNGTAWSQGQAETPATDYWGLNGVSVLPSGSTAFAAGWSQKVSSRVHTVAEIYC